MDSEFNGLDLKYEKVFESEESVAYVENGCENGSDLVLNIRLFVFNSMK